MKGSDGGFLCIRIDALSRQGTLSRIEGLWREYSNRQPFEYTFFADAFNANYEPEFKTGRILIYFSALAIFIACLGLIGLITYLITIRTREVGIRKTFGATSKIIVTLLSREVLGLILISSLVAYPVAYFATRTWLSSFAEKVNINPVIYLISSVIGLGIGLLSITYQSLKAAAMNPSDALRYK
jgi:putative ABC transport system permease protein